MTRSGNGASRQWSRLALAAALAPAACSCPEPPKITAIEIVPSSVEVAPDATNTTLVLEARLWTGTPELRQSIIPQDGYSLTWHSDKLWLTKVSENGFRATFRVTGGTPPGTAHVTVKADGKTSPDAPVTVASSALTGQDMAKAVYVPAKIPDAVAVNGIRNAVTNPCEVTLTPFVTSAMLGKVVDACAGDAGGWGAAVLAEDRRMLLTPGPWTPNPPADVVDAGGGGTSAPLSLPIALRVMVGVTSTKPADLKALQDEALDLAQDDIASTNDLLRETRAGIRLAVHDIVTIPTVPGDGAVDVGGCAAGDADPKGQDTGKLLNVYYVNTIQGDWGLRGLTCAWHTPRPQDVIYVAYAGHSPSSLVHELGHALGLTLPGQGHADMVKGLDESNIMTGGEDDNDRGGRRRLTVGQVFRMNAEPASWLNWAVDGANVPVRGGSEPRVACKCGITDPVGPCPPLKEDVAPPSQAPGNVEVWNCVDELQLRTMDETEEPPVALFAGRPWRASLTGCLPDLPGLPEKRWIGATFIHVENLTRPGNCPSWVALFSPVHAVRHIYLRETLDSGWTQAADLWIVSGNDPLPVMLDLTVHLYANPGGKTARAADIADLTKIFDASSWSGIKLTLDPQPMPSSGSCPAPVAWPRELSVCYSSAGGTEATLTGPGVIEVSIPHWTESTVRHFVGQAFGLRPLKTSDPQPPDNLMRELLPRGRKLTLGQVFRINATLNPSSLPNCNSDPASCPSVIADVAR